MKKISIEAVNTIINLLAGSSHPTVTFNVINDSIKFLQNLEYVTPTDPAKVVKNK